VTVEFASTTATSADRSWTRTEVTVSNGTAMAINFWGDQQHKAEKGTKVSVLGVRTSTTTNFN